MDGSFHERLTRSLAYMLRHQPDEFDLELDRHGYGDLDDVVHALNERLGEPVDVEDVLEAIEGGDRPRYEVVEDRIRALYGHSIEIDPGEGCEPPEFLYAGIGSRDARRVDTEGLRSGRRTFLHLALTHEEARESGRRVAEEYAVVTVHALDAWEDGIEFYDRKALYLSEGVPAEFCELGELFDDGVRRDRRGPRADRDRGGRGERDRGSRDRGPRGGRGGHDRGRPDRRDHWDDRAPDDEAPQREPRREQPRQEPALLEELRQEELRPAAREQAPRPEHSGSRATRTGPDELREPKPTRAVRDEGGSEDSGPFGGGVFDRPARPRVAEAEPRDSRPAPARAARQESATEPRTEPRTEPARPPEGPSGFGAGVL